MNDQLEILVQQEIDGVNTPSETSRLQQAIQSDPTIQARLDEYRSLDVALAAIPFVEPPDNFTDRVMGALPARQLAGSRDRAAISKQFSFRDLLAGPRFKLAYAFAIGALLAIAGTLTVIAPQVDPMGAVGTMVNISKTTQMQAGPVAVSVSSTGSKTRLVADLPADVEVRFIRADGLPLSAWEWNGAGEPELALFQGVLSVSNGPGQITLTLETADVSGLSVVALRAGVELGRFR